MEADSARLARVLGALGVIVFLVAVAGAWLRDQRETAAVLSLVQKAHAEGELPKNPPARRPGGLDFRPLRADVGPEDAKGRRGYRLKEGTRSAQKRGPRPQGIVLINIDTLRADFTAVGGAAETATPTIAELAANSTVFSRAFAQSNETLFSHASFFTSQIPSQLGEVDYDLTIRPGTPTLAGALSQAGWRTGAVVGGGHLARVFGLDDGFQDYVEGKRWGSFQETVPMAVRWLEKTARSEQPFFLFLQTYDTHAPYTKPHVFGLSATPGYDGPLVERADDSLMYERIYDGVYYPDFPLRTDTNQRGTRILTPRIHDELPAWAERPDAGGVALSDDDVAYLRGLYGTSVFYADAWLGVFLDELARLGLMETTTIVLVSDHGEELLDHGYMSHRNSLHDAATQVPFLIRRPGGGPARVDQVVELTDLAPTLLELAGVPIPTSFQGRSLMGCLERGRCPVDGAAYAEGILGLVSVTNGVRRITLSGNAPHDPAVDTLLASAAPSVAGVTYLDNSGPPGSEQPASGDGLFTMLVDAAKQRRAE